METSIYKDLDSIKTVALHYAKEHKCNYNIILHNPENGEFGEHSTYEYVTDSYFEKERPNCKLLFKTDDLLELEEDPMFNSGNDTYLQAILDMSYPIRYDAYDYDKVPARLRNAKIEPVRTEPKIERNSPCPCGSGKKYKKCCL